MYTSSRLLKCRGYCQKLPDVPKKHSDRKLRRFGTNFELVAR